MLKQSMKEANKRKKCMFSRREMEVYSMVLCHFIACARIIRIWLAVALLRFHRAEPSILYAYNNEIRARRSVSVRSYFAPFRIILYVLFRNNYIVHNLISATVEIFNFLI